jgi:hypothetical protein
MEHPRLAAICEATGDAPVAPGDGRSIVTVARARCFVLLVAAAALLWPARSDALRLPRSVGQWRLAGKPARHVGKQLYQYMNGAAEVHRMYGFRWLRVFHYRAGARKAKVEVFRMASPAGAFGDFTHARDLEGRAVDVGQGGHVQSGVLWFWQGPYLVCVSSPTGRLKHEALERLATAVARRLPASRWKPALVERLPTEGLRKATVRSFSVPAALAYHYGDFEHIELLRLGGKARAVLADYKGEAGAAVLLLVRYPSPSTAAGVAKRLSGALGGGLVRGERGVWRAVKVDGRHLRVVLEARTRAEAKRLLGAKGARQ